MFGFVTAIVLKQSKVGIDTISSFLMKGRNAIAPDVLKQILLFLPDKNEVCADVVSIFVIQSV